MLEARTSEQDEFALLPRFFVLTNVGVVFFERVLVFVEGFCDPRLGEIRDVAENHPGDFVGF